MFDRPDRRWLSWRLAPTPRPAAPAGRRAAALAARAGLAADPLAPLKAEAPGEDGVRHALVARVRQLIADGAYDTPDRWAAAEDRILDRAGS